LEFGKDKNGAKLLLLRKGENCVLCIHQIHARRKPQRENSQVIQWTGGKNVLLSEYEQHETKKKRANATEKE